MSFNSWLPLLIVLSSLVPGLVIFLLREESHVLRTVLNLFGAIVKLLLVGLLIWGVFHAETIETRWALAPGLVVMLSGADFTPSVVAPFLDEGMKIVFVVEGDTPAAAMARLVIS